MRRHLIKSARSVLPWMTSLKKTHIASHFASLVPSIMTHSSIFRVSSAFNAMLLACIILKHVMLSVARSTIRHACIAILFPIVFLHIAIIDG